MIKTNTELKNWTVNKGEFYYSTEKDFPTFIIKGCYVKSTKYENITFELEAKDIDSIEIFRTCVVPETEPIVKNYCISLSIETKFIKQFKADLKEGDFLNCSIQFRKVSNFQNKNYIKCYLTGYKKVEPPVIKMDLSHLD